MYHFDVTPKVSNVSEKSLTNGLNVTA